MNVTEETLFTQLEPLLGQPDAAEQLGALLEEAQPFDVADALSQLTDEKRYQLLSILAPAMAAESLEHLEYTDQYRMLDHIDQQQAQQILNQMSSDAVADLIGAIHPRQAIQLLNLLPREYEATIRRLAQYPENSAGGRMTVDFISVRQHMTAEGVLDHVRKVGREAETINYIFVVDPAGRLKGVASLRDVLLSPRQMVVSEFMTEQVISVPATMDQEEVARIVSQYDFLAVPVVSADNRLLGIITVDDVIDVIQEEATEDALRMAATSVPEGIFDRSFLMSVWGLAKPRLPWLLSLLFLEMGSSVIVARFSGLVDAKMAVLLALFTVVMAGESGNAATQALAVVVRGLATGEIETKDMPKVVLREALVGVIVGVITGGTLMVAGWIWQRNLVFGLAVGLALAVNLFIAKVLGGLFPIVIQRLGIDPAVASGPFITTLTDNSSMLVYYGVAALILHGLT